MPGSRRLQLALECAAKGRSGTLVTGGHIVNGRKSAPDSPVTKILNGPSCSGSIDGADVVKKVVNAGM